MTLRAVVYNGEEGQLTLLGTAPGIAGTAGFVGRLRATGCFDLLDYTGYQEEQGAGGAGATGNYQFTITGTLKGREADASVW